MNLKLLRYSVTKESTLGVLFNANSTQWEFLCYTLEDAARDQKIKHKTCIPAGSYELTLRTEGGFHQRYSKKFKDIHKGMLYLNNVPGFEYILIHCGNDKDDTSGCILVGDTAIQNVTKPGFIGESVNCYKRIYPAIADALVKKDLVTIDIFSPLILAC